MPIITFLSFFLLQTLKAVYNNKNQHTIRLEITFFLATIAVPIIMTFKLKSVPMCLGHWQQAGYMLPWSGFEESSNTPLALGLSQLMSQLHCCNLGAEEEITRCQHLVLVSDWKRVTQLSIFNNGVDMW